MPLQFVSREKRDELAERLLEIANSMQRSFDQGNDGRVPVSDEMIEDIKTAVCCVALAEIVRVDAG